MTDERAAGTEEHGADTETDAQPSDVLFADEVEVIKRR